MIRFVFLFAGLFISTSLFAQEFPKIDSLKKAIQAYVRNKANPNHYRPQDTVEADLLLDLSNKYLNYHPDSTFIYAKKSELIARALKDTWRLSHCYGDYGRANFMKMMFDSAIYYFEKELTLLHDMDSLGLPPLAWVTKYIAGANVNIGVMYGMKNEYFEQLRYNHIAINFIESKHDSSSLPSIYQSTGELYSKINNVDQARLNYKKSLDISRLLKDSSGIANASIELGIIEHNLGNDSLALDYIQEMKAFAKLENFEYNGPRGLDILGVIYTRRHQYDEALKYYTLAYLGYNKYGNIQGACGSLLGIGDMYAQQHKYDSAFYYMYKALDTITAYGFTSLASFYHYNIGQIYFDKGDKEKALQMLLKGITLAKETNSLVALKNSYELLSKIYVDKNDYKKAYTYYVLYSEMNDSIYNQENINKISQLGMQFEIDKEQESQKNIQLKKDLLHDKELLGQKQQKRMYIGGGVFALFMVFGLVNRLQFTRRTKRQLEKKNIEIQEEKNRAEQSERFKQQFLTNMSHEIRTPMNAVMGMTNLLLQKQPRTDQEPYLSGIQKSSENLLHIINDILDLSKIEAGKIEIEKIDFSLPEVARQVEQILQLKAAEKDLHLYFEVDPTIPVLLGDPVRLYQVIMNLVGNAIKFTEKGSVHLIIQRMSTMEPQNVVPIQFKVVDTGIGIPKDKLETVFEHFKQASSSDSRKYGGTGLGLTISKQLVELLGGTIAIESEEGVGTTFSFVLQYDAGSAERLQQEMNDTQAIDGSILNGLRILVADDNEYNLIVATDSLRLQADLTIMTAHNGNVAIRLLEENDFDLILMDVQMPELNGFEATRYIRDHLTSPKKDIPIIALTASVLRVDLDKTRQAGMNSYISKPYSTAQLIRGIAEVMNIKLSLIEKHKTDKQSTVTAISSATAVTDLTFLRNFCNQNEEAVKKYVIIFLNTAPLWLEKLRSAQATNKFAGIASELHGFGTKFMMFGMKRAKELAMQIEFQCRNESPPPDTLSSDLALLMQWVEKAVVELKQIDLAD